MAVNMAGLRRNIKNVAHNYTDAQVKVREATSNDPWGPSSTMMAEIADLTYNVVAFSEIMQMLWKRLHDNGKNWRHVFKSLVLLEYLIKTGSEKVSHQCRENIHALQALKDFQYLDDNKDQGINVREKAKSLVALLRDDERLKNERVKAIKAKERFAQSTSGIGSHASYGTARHPHHPHDAHHVFGASGQEDEAGSPEMEAARPQTAGEEELQLQLALAMSREEAEQEENKSKSDDMRLQLALQKSKEEEDEKSKQSKPSNDLLDLDFSNFSSSSPSQPLQQQQQPEPPTRTSASLDPWGLPVSPQAVAQAKNDPWAPSAASPVASNRGDAVDNDVNDDDPWSPVKKKTISQQPTVSPIDNSSETKPTSINDPWKPVGNTSNVVGGNLDSMDLFSPQAQSQLEEFDVLRDQIEASDKAIVGGDDPFDLSQLKDPLSDPIVGGARPKSVNKSVMETLNEHSNLVNLDNLVTASPVENRNPFEHAPPNPFAIKNQKPPLNELLNQNQQDVWSSQHSKKSGNEADNNDLFFS